MMKGKDLIKFITENNLEDATVYARPSACTDVGFGWWDAADNPDDAIEYSLVEDGRVALLNRSVQCRIELFRYASDSWTDLTVEEALALRKARVPID